MLGPLIGLFKYANSQTASDLLVAPSAGPPHLRPDSSVNTFFHNGHLLENHNFAGELPDLATANDKLVTTVQHLTRTKNSNQKPTDSDQRSQQTNKNSGKNAGQHTTPSTSSANGEPGSTSNKNRSARTSNQRNDNSRRLKQSDSKKKNNSTDSGLSSSVSAQSAAASVAQSAASSNAQTAAHSTVSKSANQSQSPNQSAPKPTATTNKQSNEKRKQSETNSEHVNSSAKLNESKADTRPASVAGNASREKSDLNLEEIAEESLKIESIGSSSVEYITDDEEKRTAAAGRQPSPSDQSEDSAPNTSNDLLHTGYKLANLEGESSLEIKDVYTDSQGEYLFNHQPLPHKMQYESEIQRLDGE